MCVAVGSERRYRVQGPKHFLISTYDLQSYTMRLQDNGVSHHEPAVRTISRARANAETG